MKLYIKSNYVTIINDEYMYVLNEINEDIR